MSQLLGDIPFKVKRRLRMAGHRFRARWIDARRGRNLQLSREDAEGVAVRARGMPTMLHVQTTRKCNFRCIMCVRFAGGYAGNRVRPEMPLSLLQKSPRRRFLTLTPSSFPRRASRCWRRRWRKRWGWRAAIARR